MLFFVYTKPLVKGQHTLHRWHLLLLIGVRFHLTKCDHAHTSLKANFSHGHFYFFFKWHAETLITVHFWLWLHYMIIYFSPSQNYTMFTPEPIIIIDAVFTGCGAVGHCKYHTVNWCLVLFMMYWRVQVIFNGRFVTSIVQTAYSCRGAKFVSVCWRSVNMTCLLAFVCAVWTVLKSSIRKLFILFKVNTSVL